jgi:hypothetical protein
VVAFRVMSGDPETADVPGGLLALVMSALAKEPGDRPTAAMLAEERTAGFPRHVGSMIFRQCVPLFAF